MIKISFVASPGGPFHYLTILSHAWLLQHLCLTFHFICLLRGVGDLERSVVEVEVSRWPNFVNFPSLLSNQSISNHLPPFHLQLFPLQPILLPRFLQLFQPFPPFPPISHHLPTFLNKIVPWFDSSQGWEWFNEKEEEHYSMPRRPLCIWICCCHLFASLSFSFTRHLSPTHHLTISPSHHLTIPSSHQLTGFLRSLFW